MGGPTCWPALEFFQFDVALPAPSLQRGVPSVDIHRIRERGSESSSTLHKQDMVQPESHTSIVSSHPCKCEFIRRLPSDIHLANHVAGPTRWPALERDDCKFGQVMRSPPCPLTFEER